MEYGSRMIDFSAKKKELRNIMLQRRGELTEEQRQAAALLLAERILGHQWFYRSEFLLGYAAYGSEIKIEEILREALRLGKRVYLPRVVEVPGDPRSAGVKAEPETWDPQSAGVKADPKIWNPQSAVLQGEPDQEEGRRAGQEIMSDPKRRIQKAREMEFYRISSLSELQPGYRGIPEPSERGERYVYDAGEKEHVLMLMPGVAFDPYRSRLGYGGGFYDRYLADKEELQLRTIGVGFWCQMAERLPAEERDIKPCQVICV